jgi:hypothetical protein
VGAEKGGGVVGCVTRFRVWDWRGVCEYD